MKILFVLENYLPHIGGVEAVFKNLSEGLVKLGHECSVITHRLKGTKKFEIMNGVKVHRVSCFGSRYFFSFFAILKVLKLGKGVDVIHTTTYNGALPAKIGALFLRKPAVITVHEILGRNWKSFDMGLLSAKLHEFLEKIIIRLNFSRYVGVSKSTSKQIVDEGVKKEKVVTIYNGVDYDFFNSKKYDGNKVRKKFGVSSNFVYFFYGRPGVSKGLEFLIKAVPLIAEGVSGSKLLAIVSKDKQYFKRYKRIVKLIEKLGVKDKIILVEPVSYKELPNYIKAADCVVVPSLTEGFGYTVAESCAMGKAVVASNTTSIPEVISGRYVLVKPRNSEEIAKGVELIYKKKIKDIGLKRFGLKENINKYLKLYRSLNENKRNN